MKYENISMIGDERIRFVLKKDGKNPLVVIGINPSTADDLQPDHTISKVMGFADRLGFDGFVMINIYPLRSTDPRSLPKVYDINLHKKNLTTIKETLSSLESPTILVAYGNAIKVRPYLRQFLSDIMPIISNHKTIQLGELTAANNPRHPSRPSYKTPIKPFDFHNI